MNDQHRHTHKFRWDDCYTASCSICGETLGDEYLLELLSELYKTPEPEKQRPLGGLALGMYASEPCRICGQMMTPEDIDNGAVFVGYAANSKSRAAHELCWRNAMEIFWR